MKAGSPAFQFYPKDYVSSANVRMMTYEERGMYVELLCHAWLEGSVPSDTDRIARLLSLPPADFERAWPAIAPCFEARGDGELVNARLERERQNQEAYRETQSENGRKGARARWGPPDGDPNGGANGDPNGDGIARGMANTMAKNSSPSPSPSPEVAVVDGDARERAASDVIIAANRGMKANAEIGDRFSPIPTGHSSRSVVLDWLTTGVSPELAASVVEDTARAYRPSGRNRQIRAMGYFTNAVLDANEREALGSGSADTGSPTRAHAKAGDRGAGFNHE